MNAEISGSGIRHADSKDGNYESYNTTIQDLGNYTSYSRKL